MDTEYFKHIEPREAFSGGRTEAFKLYYKVDESKGEEINYIDITSLYPFINYTGEYPIGEPTIIKDNFDYTLKSYYGYVKCKVIPPPPEKLYIPVLWHHDVDNENKLIFDLKEKIRTWTAPELIKAIEKGYYK